ncbi:hypothetical protein [Streptomyces sp. NPDC048442]|uniref:hypothetical protein n=1 Tax=Streptomyces sp. NPDC048442 TaxID=3154823 RepID=UPI0034186A9A
MLSAATLESARRTLPYPAAHAVHELQRAHTDKDRYDALLHAAEILAITVCVTAAAVLQGWGEEPADGGTRRQSPGSPYLLELRDLYARGATFGSWPRWLDRLGPLASSHPDLFPALWDALADRPGDPGFAAHLKALRDERGRPAHGDRPQSQEEAALRIAECGHHLERALLKTRFLQDMPWLLIVSCSYHPKAGSFEVVTHRLVGDHPDFDRSTFTWNNPVADDTLYVLAGDHPVALSPFVAFRYCEQCTKREVCYTQRAGKTGPAILKSFDRGHQLPDPKLGDESRSLFGSLTGGSTDQRPAGGR